MLWISIVQLDWSILVSNKNVTAIPDLVGFFKKLSLKNPLVVSPDQGGKERAKEFAKEFNLDYIALEKTRDRKNR